MEKVSLALKDLDKTLEGYLVYPPVKHTTATFFTDSHNDILGNLFVSDLTVASSLIKLGTYSSTLSTMRFTRETLSLKPLLEKLPNSEKYEDRVKEIDTFLKAFAETCWFPFDKDLSVKTLSYGTKHFKSIQLSYIMFDIMEI